MIAYANLLLGMESETGVLHRFNKWGKHPVMRPPRLPVPADAYNVQPTYFTPAGAELATGLSTEMQRDWRKRGYVPQGNGHARFAIFDICRLFLLKRLSDRGVGPDKANTVVDSAAYALATQVLNSAEAWQFADPVSSWSIYSDEFARRTLQAHDQDLSYAVSGLTFPKFVWWADDTCSLVESFDEAISGMLSDDPRNCGPIILLDLFALAGVIIDRMPSAFAIAQLANVKGGVAPFPTSRDSRQSHAGRQSASPQDRKAE